MRRDAASFPVVVLAAGAAAIGFAACTLSPAGTNPNATSSTVSSGAAGGGTGGDTGVGGSGGAGSTGASMTGGGGPGGSGGGGEGGSGGGPTSACGGPWAHRVAQASSAMPSGLAVDSQGNIIEVTGFSGTPHPDLNDPEIEGGSSVLIVKRDPMGAVLWAKGVDATTGFDAAESVAVGSDDRIFVTGQVSAGADFGNNPPNINGPAMFIAGFLPDGTYEFDLQATNSHGHAAAVGTDSLAVAGHATDDVTIYTPFGPLDVNNYGGGLSDAFVVRVTATSVWARFFGNDDEQRALGVAVQSNGNVIVGGEFREQIDFGAGNEESAMDQLDGFVAKLDSRNGNGMASASIHGNTGQSVRAVAVDSADNVIIAGTIQQNITFENVQLDGNGTQDILLAKLGPNLEVEQGNGRWVKRFGGAEPAYATAVHVDAAGTIYLAGYFEGTLDLGDGVTIAGLGDSFAAFVAAFDPTGKALFARSFPVNGQDVHATGIAADGCHNIVVSGTYDGPLSFGGPALPDESGTDRFIARILPEPPLP